tara:strand:+ start:160 stop:345 length:186 start_codon:yes stop_codon:yes gene_type:complete
MVTLGMRYFNIPSLENKIVKYGANTPDGKRENDAFNIEPGLYRQIEERWRVPIFGNEQRLG